MKGERITGARAINFMFVRRTPFCCCSHELKTIVLKWSSRDQWSIFCLCCCCCCCCLSGCSIWSPLTPLLACPMGVVFLNKRRVKRERRALKHQEAHWNRQAMSKVHCSTSTSSLAVTTFFDDGVSIHFYEQGLFDLSSCKLAASCLFNMRLRYATSNNRITSPMRKQYHYTFFSPFPWIIQKHALIVIATVRTSLYAFLCTHFLIRTSYLFVGTPLYALLARIFGYAFLCTHSWVRTSLFALLDTHFYVRTSLFVLLCTHFFILCTHCFLDDHDEAVDAHEE